MSPIKFIQPEKRRSPFAVLATRMAHTTHKIVWTIRIKSFASFGSFHFYCFFCCASLRDNGLQIGDWQSEEVFSPLSYGDRLEYGVQCTSFAWLRRISAAARGCEPEHFCIILSWILRIMSRSVVYGGRINLRFCRVRICIRILHICTVHGNNPAHPSTCPKNGTKKRLEKA